MKKLLVLVGCIAATVACAQLAQMLIAVQGSGSGAPTGEIMNWALDEGSGTTATGTSINGGDTGTHNGDYVTGASGSGFAVNFVAANSDRATNNTALTFGVNAISVSMWMYSDATAGVHEWISTGTGANSFRAFRNGANVFIYAYGDTGARAERFVNPTDTNWHHVVIHFDGSTSTGNIALWVDNSEITADVIQQNDKTGTSNFASAVVSVGSSVVPNLYYDGDIDEVKIFDHLIDSTERTDLYENP